MAPTRYLVEWTPWADVQSAALKAGMPEGGEVSDYTSLDDHESFRVFPTFSLARAYAKNVIAADTWHCPRIRRQRMVPHDHDDLGNRVPPRPDWEVEATWEVFDDSPTPDENKPDWAD